MLLIYQLAIRLYGFGIWLASFFNKKASLWIDGRKNIFKHLSTKLKGTSNIIWIHCASLGEFEQGRPIIEALQSKYSNHKILLTFYSPSGFEIRKNYKHADYVCYLPLDTKKNAQNFLDIVKPSMAIFVKYEFWYHFLNQLKTRQIPTFLISAVFRQHQLFFKKTGTIFRKMLHCFEHIFVQDEASKKLLADINVSSSIAGDTRIDRVLNIPNEAKQFPLVEQFIDNKSIIVFGSTWAEDDEVYVDYINRQQSNWKYIIAPHEIKEEYILKLENRLQVKSSRYSQAKNSLANSTVLIIDNIGILSSLYQYGKIAYIGGGFGKGIHNTLEPIAFGLPVIFGPNFHKFEEAKTLVKNGGAFSISNSKEFIATIKLLQEKDRYQSASNQAKEYLKQNKGATKKILAYINKTLP